MLNTFLRFDIFTTEEVQITISKVTRYNLVGCYWCPGTSCCLSTLHTHDDV